MTPPDKPEESPSALSRLERALAGFGDPKDAAEPEPETETEAEPEIAAEEPEVEEVAEEEPIADEEEEWAAPSSSVLDIAAAVAAVERLGTLEPGAEPISPPPLPPSDADERVLAATAAGTTRVSDEEEDDEEEPRNQYFAADEETDDEREPEPESEEPEESWERNIGDTALPYFLVEDNLPVAADPVAQIEELRQANIRPERDAKPAAAPTSLVRTLAEIPVLLIVAALIAFLVKTFLAQAYYIPSGSMLPQLQIDDRVVVSKLAYKAHDPRRGDIIVFDDPRTGAASAKSDEGLLRKVGEGIGIVQPSTDEFIKRVIGLPGETVEGKNGHVYVNGVRLIEPYLKSTVVTSDFEKQKVRPGRLWVMGDNRTGSADSRVFGQIRIDTIVGRALVKVWPVDHISFL